RFWNLASCETAMTRFESNLDPSTAPDRGAITGPFYVSPANVSKNRRESERLLAQLLGGKEPVEKLPGAEAIEGDRPPTIDHDPDHNQRTKGACQRPRADRQQHDQENQ